MWKTIILEYQIYYQPKKGHFKLTGGMWNHATTIIVWCYHCIIAFLSPHHQTSALLSTSKAPTVSVRMQLAAQGTPLPRSSAVIGMMPNWLMYTACKFLVTLNTNISSSLTLLHFTCVQVVLVLTVFINFAQCAQFYEILLTYML